MGKDDWYRNTSWNPAIEATFLKKLNRSRGQRDQYLQIQIGYLSSKHPHAALRLCDIYFETKREDTWDLTVTSAVAATHARLNEHGKALGAYRTVLSHDEKQPFFPHYVLLDAPYFIAQSGLKKEFPFALEVLSRARRFLEEQDLKFANQHFMLAASYALIYHQSGNRAEALACAAKALEIAAVKDSGLRYHRGAGLVGPEFRDTIISLKSMTSRYPVWMLKLTRMFGR